MIYTIGQGVSYIVSWNVMNIGLQTVWNWTGVFTHPLYILHSTTLPGLADAGQQMQLNQTLPNGEQ